MKGGEIMKRLDPSGRSIKTINTDANYEITPMYGCACSASLQSTALAGRYSGDCMCQCSYGEANFSANYSIGYKK